MRILDLNILKNYLIAIIFASAFISVSCRRADDDDDDDDNITTSNNLIKNKNNKLKNNAIKPINKIAGSNNLNNDNKSPQIKSTNKNNDDKKTQIHNLISLYPDKENTNTKKQNSKINNKINTIQNTNSIKSKQKSNKQSQNNNVKKILNGTLDAGSNTRFPQNQITPNLNPNQNRQPNLGGNNNNLDPNQNGQSNLGDNNNNLDSNQNGQSNLGGNNNNLNPSQNEQPNLNPSQNEQPNLNPSQNEQPNLNPSQNEQPNLNPNQNEQPNLNPNQNEQPNLGGNQNPPQNNNVNQENPGNGQINNNVLYGQNVQNNLTIFKIDDHKLILNGAKSISIYPRKPKEQYNFTQVNCRIDFPKGYLLQLNNNQVNENASDSIFLQIFYKKQKRKNKQNIIEEYSEIQAKIFTSINKNTEDNGTHFCSLVISPNIKFPLENLGEISLNNYKVDFNFAYSPNLNNQIELLKIRELIIKKFMENIGFVFSKKQEDQAKFDIGISDNNKMNILKLFLVILNKQIIKYPQQNAGNIQPPEPQVVNNNNNNNNIIEDELQAQNNNQNQVINENLNQNNNENDILNQNEAQAQNNNKLKKKKVQKIKKNKKKNKKNMHKQPIIENNNPLLSNINQYNDDDELELSPSPPANFPEFDFIPGLTPGDDNENDINDNPILMNMPNIPQIHNQINDDSDFSDDELQNNQNINAKNKMKNNSIPKIENQEEPISDDDDENI